jgi:predicted esterase
MYPSEDDVKTHRLPLALVFALLVCSVSLHAQNTYKPHNLPPALRDQALLALQQRDYPKARTLYERWLEADPRDNMSWYNLACVYSLTGEKEKAIDAFERSVDAGWEDAEHPTQDTDLDAIRADARFDAALKRIGAGTAKKGPKGFIRHYAEMKSRGSYIVMLPPDYETSKKEYPICLILHGSGSSDLGHGKLADTLGREGVIYIAPRAPYPHTGVVATGNMGWTAWPPDDLDNNDPNLAQVPIDYVNWIFTCVDEVQRNYRARKGRVYILGHSQGGNFANVSALLHPDRVASYYADAGSLPAERFLTAENFQGLKKNGVHAYLIHGEQDNVVNPESSRKIDKLLTDAGVEHRLRIVPGDHSIGGEMMKDIRAWIETEVRGSQEAQSNGE